MIVYSKSNQFFRWETDATTKKEAKMEALQEMNLDNYKSIEEAYNDLYVKVTINNVAGVDYRWER